MPDLADLLIYQGDDYSAVVTVTDGTNTPPDLSGYTAQAQIRQGPADANPDIVVDITVSLTPPNQIQLSIPRATHSAASRDAELRREPWANRMIVLASDKKP